MSKTIQETSKNFDTIPSSGKKSFLHKVITFIIIVGIIYFVAISSLNHFNSVISMALQTQRIYPVSTDFSASYPVQTLLFTCSKASFAYINDKRLSSEDLNKLCKTGYEIKLNDGENNVNIQIHFPDSSGIKFSEKINITFSKDIFDKELKENAEQYCKNRSNLNRIYGKISFKDGITQIEPSKGKIGKNLSKSNCQTIVESILKILQLEQPEIDKNILQSIIKGKYYMGMDKYLFYASVGNPDDVNSSEYGSDTQDQIIYYKDSYGISAEYFYFDNDILTSHQNF